MTMMILVIIKSAQNYTIASIQESIESHTDILTSKRVFKTLFPSVGYEISCKTGPNTQRAF